MAHQIPADVDTDANIGERLADIRRVERPSREDALTLSHGSREKSRTKKRHTSGISGGPLRAPRRLLTPSLRGRTSGIASR